MAMSVNTRIIEIQGDLYVALCPELDVASQGTTVEEATSNVREAVELFLECASPEARHRHPAVVIRQRAGSRSEFED